MFGPFCYLIIVFVGPVCHCFHLVGEGGNNCFTFPWFCGVCTARHSLFSLPPGTMVINALFWIDCLQSIPSIHTPKVP